MASNQQLRFEGVVFGLSGRWHQDGVMTTMECTAAIGLGIPTNGSFFETRLHTFDPLLLVTSISFDAGYFTPRQSADGTLLPFTRVCYPASNLAELISPNYTFQSFEIQADTQMLKSDML
ncbi:MAG: hypothetical protein R8K20_01240 [Gallionellaceae bacterium]